MLLARLDKPIGIFLLLWPTLSALVLAAEGLPETKILVIFVLGTILMRSAGCVINDFFDQKYDSSVKRTKNRALINKSLSSKDALLFFIFLIFVSFVLVLQLNKFSIFLSLIALFLAIFYPLTKRFFSIPQLFLGLAFSMAILMAFTATKNSIPSEAWLLFVANVFWALSYDTHYAVTDLKDDMNLPIHSSAKFFGRWTPHFITFNYLLMFIILFYLGFRLENSILYFLPLIIALYFALNGIYFSKKMSPEMNFMAFKKANLIGFVIFLAFLLEYL